MNNYNYLASMVEDILENITENYTPEEATEKLTNRDEWEQELQDDLWTCDSVTGNGSGSYTFNSWKAQEYVTDNTDLLREALREFETDADTIAEKFLNGEWEYFDVTIRCYLLGQAIAQALDELEETQDAQRTAFDEFCAKYPRCQGCPFSELATMDDCEKAFSESEEVTQ